MRAQWPKHLPKRFAKKTVLSVKDVAELGGITERSVQRFYIREFPNAVKLGTAFNSQYAIPVDDVIDFLDRLQDTQKSEPARPS